MGWDFRGEEGNRHGVGKANVCKQIFAGICREAFFFLFNIIIFNHEQRHNTFDFHFLSESSQILSFYSLLKFIEIISHFHIPSFLTAGNKIYIFCFYFLQT